MNPNSEPTTERPASARWKGLKPLTQGEIVHAIDVAVAKFPLPENCTSAEKGMEVRGRLCFLAGYLGNDRPALRAALTELAGMPPEEGQNTGSSSIYAAKYAGKVAP